MLVGAHFASGRPKLRGNSRALDQQLTALSEPVRVPEMAKEGRPWPKT
jgi:hypothetical protein